MKSVIAAAIAAMSAIASLSASSPTSKLDAAAAVVSDMMASPDKGIPQDLFSKAHCIVIVPDFKTAAFLVGGSDGNGFLSCRPKSGAGWSAPGAVRIEGGSVGLQLGASSTDLIMLVMSKQGADKLLSSKFTMGAEGSIAAGPVGRSASAQTDAQLHADILSWSHSKGLFAGIALQGSTLRENDDDNAELYGRKLSNQEIVSGSVQPPQAAGRLMSVLNRYSPRESND